MNCSMYTTCQETMESRNPLCGWCVFENMYVYSIDKYHMENLSLAFGTE